MLVATGTRGAQRLRLFTFLQAGTGGRRTGSCTGIWGRPGVKRQSRLGRDSPLEVTYGIMTHKKMMKETMMRLGEETEGGEGSESGVECSQSGRS